MVSNNQLHIVVATVYLERDGKFLILKRSEQEIQSPGKWTTPGGKVEAGDSIAKTAHKEVVEESGLEIQGELEYLGDDEFTRVDDLHVIALRFLAKAKQGEVRYDKKDFTDFAWIDRLDLDNYDLVKAVKKDLEILLEEK